MALTYTQFLMLLLIAYMLLGVTVASKGFNYGSPQTTYSDTPNRIIVGGSAYWSFGFNYSVWAFKNGPFYVNDTLVFKYDLPSENNTYPHNVYLVPDMRSFLTCNLSKGVKIANESQGAGEGFEFVLNKWRPYYFACGASDGYHCNVGGMKFFVLPLLRRWHY
ncbi:hypothetical protein P3X46_032776 [Hevea brasiliensis]|uniref:Phytocyanin domain-containing protein n=1 Tax=Hevea brasiliensis TaxID=3981 RepID=A0ABQ9KEB5_HEVBR|nr:uncharacterized protein LOC131175992 [Hevea brasiliensis]KAJ9135615.1 hypothetical protein P3X46_032776 [Hevea brasiliensis]